MRTRWTVITTTVATDAQLLVFITEADDLVVTGLADAKETRAITHMAAHLALEQHTSATTGGSGTPRDVASASFTDRSVSYLARPTPAPSKGFNESRYATTAPGKAYLAEVSGSRWGLPIATSGVW